MKFGGMENLLYICNHKDNKMNKKEFLEKTGLSEKQFNGLEKIEGYLDLGSLTSIPEGFNPIVGWNLYLCGLTSIPKGFNPIVGGSLFLTNLKSTPKGFNPTVGGTLYLNYLKSTPKGFNPIVGGSLYLNRLTSITEGFNPIVGGSLFLDNLTSIPEGFNPTVGGNLDLGSLTSIPEGFNPIVGGNLYLSGLTSIPEGFNPTVGGYLDLRSLTSTPNNWNINDYEHKNIPLISFQDGKYIKADGIFTEVISKKGNVYKVKKLNEKEEFFIVGDGNGKFAHGKTLKEAKEDLIFKISNRNKEEFKNLKLDSVLKFKDAVECYRVITGACSFGTKDFVKTNNIKEKDYSIKEIIKLTEGKYGNEIFKNFFA